MPGLSPYTAFTLSPVGGVDGLYALRASDADVRLFLVDAALADAQYRPRLPASVRHDLGIADDDALRLFVIANPGEDGVHVNLRAPVVIDSVTWRATQIILDDERLPVRLRLDGTGER
jgi:flagellar assembly factor FliW